MSSILWEDFHATHASLLVCRIVYTSLISKITLSPSPSLFPPFLPPSLPHLPLPLSLPLTPSLSLLLSFPASLKMAENCSLRVLNISFCYKISSDSLDVLISTLKAKECLTSINMMGVSLRGLGMEFLSTCSSLTHLSLSGVRELDDNNLEMVSLFVSSYTIVSAN